MDNSTAQTTDNAKPSGKNNPSSPPLSREELEKLLLAEADTEPEVLRQAMENNPKIRAMFRQSVFSGPLPPPELLEGYKRNYKNAPEIIFRMAENEQHFRHRSTYAGQLSALLIGLTGLGVTGYLGVNGQPWLAGLIGFGSLGTLVSAYLADRKSDG